MDLIADVLMTAGALAAAFYCLVLSRRLRALAALDSGLGGAIAVLSKEVDDLTSALRAAEMSAVGSSRRLEALTARGETACQRLELMLASLQGLDETGSTAGSGLSRLRVERRRRSRPAEVLQ